MTQVKKASLYLVSPVKRLLKSPSNTEVVSQPLLEYTSEEVRTFSNQQQNIP